jgi:hypothetical protein
MPINQQTNPGFNAPRFSVCSDDPVVATIAAASFKLLRRPFSDIGPANRSAMPILSSDAFAVGHVAAIACFLIATRPALFPASLFPFFAGARLVGVGQADACAAIAGSG